MSEDKDGILKEVLRLLGEKYQPGLYEYLVKYRPEMHRALMGLEERIERAFLSNGIDNEGFKIILREYWRLHIRALELFSAVGQMDFDLPEIREKMSEEAVKA